MTKNVFLAFYFFTTIFITQSLASADDSCQCDPCNCQPYYCPESPLPFCPPSPKRNCGFTIGAEYLIWKPVVDDLEFAAVTNLDLEATSNPRVDYSCIDPDWASGIRGVLALERLFNSCGFKFSYTYIKPNDDAAVGGTDNIAAILAHPNLIGNTLFEGSTAKWELSYQEWEALITYVLKCDSVHIAVPYFGAAGVRIKDELFVTYNTDTINGTVDWSSELSGAGLRAGFDYTCYFENALRFYGSLSGTLLVSDKDSYNTQQFNNALNGKPINFRDCKDYFLIPGYRLSAGIAADGKFCDVDMNVHVGYEFVEWRNLPNPRRFTSTNNATIAHSSSPDTKTLGMHGLHAGLDFTF